MHIAIIAGESSGDLHASTIMEELRVHSPTITFSGIGGTLMKEQGLQQIHSIDALQVMGFSDVLKYLPKIISIFRSITRHILSQQPDAVIFVDYPGFNLRLSKKLRSNGYKGKLIHFVCPQVWAWRSHRIKELENNLDLLLCLFPFEKPYFNAKKLAVKYIGNPLLENVQIPIKPKQVPSLLQQPILAIFPGSRVSEIHLNLPDALETALKFQSSLPQLCIAISIANDKVATECRKIIQEKFYNHIENIEVFEGKGHQHALMDRASLALATCGTVNLELAIRHIPTLVIYRTSVFNRFLAKYVFRLNLPFYCIVNIILKKEVFPELIYPNFSVDKACEHLYKLSFDKKYHQHITHELQAFYHQLKQKTSPLKKAAFYIHEQLSRRSQLT